MFHYSAPFDHSHSAPSPFTHFPLSSHATSKPFLPPSYATYDEERSRIEQALLARKQQERRQAEAAAFLAEQRRLERQAAIEEAIREERERREYERALKYREEMVRRAREEEEVKQRYIQAMRVQQELARRQALQEQQEQRRRTERATEQQRQIDQSSSLDTVPDLFRLLFGGRSTQDEPDSVSQPSTPSPVQPQPSHSEQPKLDLPHFLEAIFGTPQPSANAQASPAPRQATAPVSHPSPSPVAQTSSSVPALALQTGAPSCTPIVHQEPPADSASSDEEEEAARKVQRQFRRHLARRNALDKISSLSSSFVDRQSSFEKPSILTFKESSPTATSSTTTPSLAFVSSNSPFLAHEDYLVNLLGKIDAVESGGDRQVKKERKSLVRKVEKELSRLDAMKERAWEEQVKAAQVAAVGSKVEEKVGPEAEIVEPEQEVTAEETSPSATVPQTLPSEELSPSVDASLPTSSPETDTTLPYADSAPAPPSDDDLEPLIPADDQNTTSKLTEEAVSSFAPHSTDIAPSPASDDASSTTSSTLTESSEGSPSVEEALRRAEKLGREVEKLELAENPDRNEEYVFVL